MPFSLKCHWSVILTFLVLYTVSLSCATPGESEKDGKYPITPISNQYEYEYSNRQPKWMNLLGLGRPPFVKIVIPPDTCGSTGNGVRDGVCLPKGQCELRKGETNGDCAKGFGQCCRFRRSCNTTRTSLSIDDEVVILESPSNTQEECRFQIYRRKPDKIKYCGIRLDFVEFRSASADADGQCADDSIAFVGSPTVADWFKTCGVLRDQHMYLAFGRSNAIDIIPSFTSTNAQYRIVVTQIPCIGPQSVPSYCLQYYNSSRDMVQSFDWPNQQQSNQIYTICVGGGSSSGTTNGGSSITWRGCRSGTTAANPPLDIVTVLPSNNPREQVCKANRDWIQVNGQGLLCRPTDVTGSRGVSSSFTPFLLNVHFDEVEKQDLPCVDSWIDVNDPATCAALHGADSCVMQFYDGCTWNTNTNSTVMCQCMLKDMYPLDPQDGGNRGFCLEYTQNSR